MSTVRYFGRINTTAAQTHEHEPIHVRGQSVPAIFIFGDSVVDNGNNNQIATVVKSNFPPYGRDFTNHEPTGRFCNGRLVTDIIAEDYIGFNSYPPAYLTEKARGRNLLNGTNFASAGSGYYEQTAELNLVVSLNKQLDNYYDYQAKLVEIIGESNASSIFSDALYIVSTGSSDFIQNYYINPVLQSVYTTNQFFIILLRNYAEFITNLHGMGARKIGVTTLPPLGCLPAAITLFGLGSNQCIEKFNNDAISFNRRLNRTSENLRNRLPNLNLVVLDVYQPLYDLITNPVEHGFSEARKGCCGTGLLETSILCNELSIGTCSNASEYIFWDAFHPTEAANKILADSLIKAGSSLIYR
ncbi:Lipase [Trema orientale]|uniref:Lipase n=1 Tax=Trema orientale TaxID=63057 RepID=A0A2P5DD63_TREOI|nr:Lipase [Trema orientale]